MVDELVKDCDVEKGKHIGHPHLCGVSFPCGKNDDHALFLAKARAHAEGTGKHVSAGYSINKAKYIISLVEDFKSGKISAEKISKVNLPRFTLF